MKKVKKIVLITAGTIVILIVAILSYITLALPNVGAAENIKVELTIPRIARGQYLANHVVLCMDCHSTRDESNPFSAITFDKKGAGGNVFNGAVGFPGEVHVPNITPFHLKDWTDGEIFRAITTGVRKDGSAIFPLMPWPYYSQMSREDVYAVVAYLRTLKPIETSYPRSKLNFPLNILVHTMPQKAELGTIPPVKDTIKYGEYLTRSAACKECHSQSNNGKLLPGLEFAGGHSYIVRGKTIYTANITPDKLTGIGNWTREAFVKRFKSFTDTTGKAPKPFVTIMPWYDYGGMTETDLKAIYAYLLTVKPVKNKVVNSF